MLFQDGRRVTSVATTGLGDRTSRGIGVRSKRRAVRRRVDGITCQRFPEGASRDTGEFEAGGPVTGFLLDSGRVVRVTVGFVID